MRDKLVNYFIVILLILLIVAFYFYWGTVKKVSDNEENTSMNSSVSVNDINEVDNKMDEYNKKYREVADKIMNQDRRGDLEKEEEKMMKELVETPIMTVSEIEEKAEEVYADLLPAEFDSDVEIMDEALNELDIKSDEIDAKLMEEETEIMELNSDITSNENEEDINEEENLENLESEEVVGDIDEGDVDSEDINNI